MTIFFRGVQPVYYANSCLLYLIMVIQSLMTVEIKYTTRNLNNVFKQKVKMTKPARLTTSVTF